MKNYLKRFIIIISIFTFLTIAFYLLTPIFPRWAEGVDKIINPNKYQPRQFVLITDSQDKFLVIEQLIHTFPDNFYNYEIYDANSSYKKSVVKLRLVKKIDKINELYKDPYLKCYLAFDYILYKRQHDSGFNALRTSELNKIDPNNYLFLISPLKQLFRTNWQWMELTAHFLIRAKDKETIDTLKRYSLGNFTENETVANQYTGFTPEEIQQISKDLLKYYGIKFSLKPN